MKKTLTNNIALKLISLFFAAIFWIVVVNVDDPEVTRSISGIPVIVLDEGVITNQNQVYEIASGDMVAITVTGPRSQVDKMTRDDFLAEAPFSEKSNVDAVPIYVSFRNSKYEKTCEINQKTRTMKLQVENIVSKSYEININKTGNEMAGYMIGKETLSPSTVTVTAPESVIDIISKVQVNLDASGHTESFSEELPIMYYTETGSVITMNDHVNVSAKTTNISVQIYSIKEVPLKFGSSGTVADGYELVEITSNKQTVKIAGTAVDQIDSIELPEELINISGATQDVVVNIDVAAQLPAGTTLVDEENGSIVTVTAKIEQLVRHTYNLPISEIDMHNLSEELRAEFMEQSISFRLTGRQSVHDSFNMGDLNAYVDLRNAREGINEVIVRMTVPEGLKLSSEVRANVQVTGIQAETTSPPESDTEPETDTTETSAPLNETKDNSSEPEGESSKNEE
ncbi:MAG: hypothetical protein HFI34_05885 [Lachnospiraceae bacterium]|nr:hypothetical protein [Lachnospiraceae bacterium]